jgi:transposase
MEICTNLLGELTYLKMMNLKPNYSDLARKYKVDRHTIAKYYRNGGKIIKQRTFKKSCYDDYKEEIIELLSKPGVTKMAAFQFLCDKYEKFHKNYNTFKSFTLSRGIKTTKTKIEPHVRFETNPGEQLQVDWKESLKMTSSQGEVFEFHIYTATLGYSRLHIFNYSKTKTTEDFIRCTIETFKKIGGLPKHILTDNMSAVVSIKNGTKEKNYKIKQFEKDMGIKIKLCKARSPETKGKDESSNRFISWLLPYDGKFKDEAELISIINKVNNQVNQQINRTTNMPPLSLYAKEKEYLNPIPNNLLLESYIEGVITQVVPPTLLVSFQGSGYSVPCKYINKRVKLLPIDNKLYIYYNDLLLTVHTLSSNKFNYKNEHYTDALKTMITSKDDKSIEVMASNNLKMFDNLKK